MNRFRKRYLFLGIFALIVIGATVTYFFPAAAPWSATGHLVIAVRSVPLPDATSTIGFGMEDMELLAHGDSTRISVLPRRVTLDPTEDTITVVMDTGVRAGTYDGFSFLMSSPEERNPWQQDAPPESVALVHDLVLVPVPYTVVEGQTTVILLSFETLQAIHERKDGNKYLPVIQVETRYGGTIGTDESGATRVAGGAITGSATYGMDWNGRMRQNFRATDSEPVDATIPTPQEPEAALSTGDTASTTASTTEPSTDATTTDTSDATSTPPAGL
jgi:hypothetical protein